MLCTLMTAVLLAQAPADRPAGAPSERRAAELRKTVEQRRRRDAERRHAYLVRLRDQDRRRSEARAQADREAALIAVRKEREARVRALQAYTGAVALQADLSVAQYRLNSQVAGAPQVFVPGVGMMPYAYGVAPPYWWGLRRSYPVPSPSPPPTSAPSPPVEAGENP